MNYILAYCNLDKFTGQTYEDMGFELMQHIDSFIISESITNSKRKQLYNCGQNVYIFKGEMISSGTESAEWSF